MNKPVITKGLADKLALQANGSYSNEGNALQHTLYDTALAPAALGANVNYFTQPIGAAYANGNKTINETNLSDPGKLPNGQTFLANAFSLALKVNAASVAAGTNELWEDVMSGFYSYIQNSVFEVVIAGREYEYQVPGTELLPAAPVALTSSLAAASGGPGRSGDYWTSGWCKLNVTPIVLGNQVSFSVKQIMGNQITAGVTAINTAMALLNAQDAEIQVRMRGILTRSI
jgi:hypothetical protein